LTDADLGEVGVLAQLVDVDVLKLRPKAVYDVGNQVMRQGPGRCHLLDASVDAGRLKDADYNGEDAIAVDFLEPNHLVVDDFADDDPFQLHLDRHVSLAFNWHTTAEGARRAKRNREPRLDRRGPGYPLRLLVVGLRRIIESSPKSGQE